MKNCQIVSSLKNSFHVIISTLLVLIFTIVFSTKTVKAEDSLLNACKSYLLQNAYDASIISSFNPDQKLPPASMVKLMTLYTILSKKNAGVFSFEDKVSVSGAASKIGGSQVYLKENEVFSVYELLEALMVQSGNDAAHALAEFASGSVEEFVSDMNTEAKKIGLQDSVFHSPHGLPAPQDRQEDLVTARDFSILSRKLIIDHPEILKLTSIKEKPFRDGSFIMRNHNHLIGTFGVDGLKTGFHSKAGFNLAATAEKDGVRIITIAMGCEKRKERDQLTSKLIREGLAKIKLVDFSNLLKSENLAADVIGGVPSEVPISPDEPLQAVIPVDDKSNVTVEVTPCKNIQAPFESGLTCGSAKIMLNKQVLKTVNLLTELGSRKQTLMEKIKSKVGWSQ